MPRFTDLTSPEIGALTRQNALCLLPIGQVEEHGDHLPTGTDATIAGAAVEAAALVGCDPKGSITTARVAIGAVAPTPLRCPAGEQQLIGQPPSPEGFAAAAERCAAIASPIDDVRASAAYRRTVLPVLIRRALEGAAATAGGAP